MHGIDAKHLRELVIRPTLRALDPEIPYSDVAVELLVLTAATESHMGRWLRQNDGEGNPTGVALGIYQMEPRTHRDHCNWLTQQEVLFHKTADLMLQGPNEVDLDLIYSLTYATAMARVHYWRHPSALPVVANPMLLATYYKKVWNTSAGKATVEKAAVDYLQYTVG